MQDFKISLTEEDQMDMIQGYHSLQLENNRLKAENKMLQDAEDERIMAFEKQEALSVNHDDLCKHCPKRPTNVEKICDLYRRCDFHINADYVFSRSYSKEDHLWFHNHGMNYFLEGEYTNYGPDGFVMDFSKYSRWSDCAIDF